MFPGDILIDGYNVLHAAGFAQRSYNQGEFEKRRLKLLRLISQQLSPRERLRTTVVFDATDRSVMRSAPREREGLLVIFAGDDGDADATIERLIRQNSAPKRLCVVSSDHRLQKAARRRRAKFIDSDVFLQRLARRPTPEERRQRQVEPDAKHSGKLPPGEVDAWLRVFDDIEQSDPSSPMLHKKQRTEASARKASRKHRRSKPDKTSVTSSERLSNEVEFWESRVAELWDDNCSSDD